MLAFADIGRDQSESLIYNLINEGAENPEILEKIFESKEFSDRYQKVISRATSHLSKREYYKNQGGKMEVWLKNH